MTGSFAAIAGLTTLLAIAAAADASASRRVSDILISSLSVLDSLPKLLRFL
jgi:ABC-type anion transport system duplicated permease subunit